MQAQAEAARQVSPSTVVNSYGKGNPNTMGGQVAPQGMVNVYSNQQQQQQQQQQLLRPQHQHNLINNMGQPMNQMAGGPMGKPNAMVQQHLMQGGPQQQQQQQQQPNRQLPGIGQVWNR